MPDGDGTSGAAEREQQERGDASGHGRLGECDGLYTPKGLESFRPPSEIPRAGARMLVASVHDAKRVEEVQHQLVGRRTADGVEGRHIHAGVRETQLDAVPLAALLADHTAASGMPAATDVLLVADLSFDRAQEGDAIRVQQP